MSLERHVWKVPPKVDGRHKLGEIDKDLHAVPLRDGLLEGIQQCKSRNQTCTPKRSHLNVIARN